MLRAAREMAPQTGKTSQLLRQKVQGQDEGLGWGRRRRQSGAEKRAQADRLSATESEISRSGEPGSCLSHGAGGGLMCASIGRWL